MIQSKLVQHWRTWISHVGREWMANHCEAKQQLCFKTALIRGQHEQSPLWWLCFSQIFIFVGFYARSCLPTHTHCMSITVLQTLLIIRQKRSTALGESWKYSMGQKNRCSRSRCVEISWYLSDRKSGVIYLTKKFLAPSQTAATAQIVPKICYGQTPTFGSRCSKFHPNRFIFGGVIAERVKTILLAHRVFAIFARTSGK